MARDYSQRIRRSGWARMLILIAICLSAFVFFTPILFGQEPKNPEDGEEEKASGNMIPFSADSLVADRETMELIGNARIERGKSVITADRIKFFLGETEGEGETVAMEQRSFEKAVATGNVRIRFEGENAGSDENVFTAEAEKAEYTTADQILILSGGKPIVRRGNNYLSGPEIIFYRKTQRLIINGKDDKGVEGEIYSEGMEFE